MGKIVHHAITDSYPSVILKGIKGAEYYAGRILASTNPSDTLILPPELEPECAWALKHYEELGIPCTKDILYGDHKLLKDFPRHELNVFFFGQRAHQMRPDQSWFDTVERFNNKNYFIKTAHEIGVKTPKTVCYRLGTAVTVPKCFPVYVKLAVSASGVGVWRCKNIDEFDQAVTMSAELGIDFQVQEPLPEGTVFLNAQYEVNHQGRLENGPVTEQILIGNSHNGNLFPTPYANQAREVTSVLASQAQQDGIKGVFAFDVAVTPQGEVLPIECNPRYNGCTYNSKVAEALGLKEWQAVNVEFKPQSVQGTKSNLDGLGFDQKSKIGIVVVNWGTVGQGKLGLLVAGDDLTRRNYLHEFRRRYS